MLGAIFTNTNVLTYLAIVATIVIFIIIYKTPFGLRLRSVGESPDAAQSVGINVKRTRFIVMLISGFLASVGGLFMSMAYLPYFTKNMLSGRGFIGLAACNLAAGHPLGAFACAVLFGAADAIANLAQTFRMPAQFASMMPYIVTIIGLCVTGYRSTHQKVKKAKEAKAA